jgi:DNA processing protein
MEFGREVYGVPGNTTQPGSFGPNHLIKQGAKPVTGWEDVVEELPTQVRAELTAIESASAEERLTLLEGSLGPAERTLYRLLTSEVLAVLFELEMKDAIRQMPGKRFVRALI